MTAKTDILRGPKDPVVKTRAVARTMTTGTALCKIPKGSRILGITIQGVASDAGTTAVVSFGNTATANEYVASHDVKTAATGTGPVWCKQVSGALGADLTSENSGEDLKRAFERLFERLGFNQKVCLVLW